MSKKSFITILLSLILAVHAEKFLNEIIYPVRNEQNIYRFYLEIEEAVSMNIWNDERKTYDPVIKKDSGTFYVRQSAYSDTCDSLRIVNNTKQLDSIIIASGLHRHLLLINKTFPGPPIIVPHNSHVEITVKNKLMSDTVSLHWHGITQKNTFWMDGAARVTQCPIMPGEKFTYKFKATEKGTHWFHSHSGVQRTEGMYAPLIVTDRYADNNPVDELDTPAKEIKFHKEFLFLIQDLFHEHSTSILNYYDNDNMKYAYGYTNLVDCYRPTRMDDGAINTALPFKSGLDTIIINGKGSYKLFKNSKNIQDVDRNIGRSAFKYNFEEFEVEPNKAYLFRVIGSNSGLALQIRVGGHKMTVVAVDGNKIKPIKNVDSLIVNAGERFDFYIETKDYDDQSNYFIVVKTIETTDFFFNKLDYDNFGLAVLKYRNAVKKTVKCLDACQPLERNSLVVNCPYWSSKTEGFYKCLTTEDFKSYKIKESDKKLLKSNYDSDDFERFNEFEEHFLNTHFSGIYAERASINGRRFMSPSFPPFFSKDFSDSYVKCSSDSLTSDCTNSIRIGQNKTIQFVISNMGTGATINRTHHPIHLHGHQFYVIAMGFSNYNNETKRIMTDHNKDIACLDDKLCNRPRWSNQTWQLGNIPHANLIDPPLRDTLTIPKGGYAVIRFSSNNPGLWLMHCHIEIHVAQGMSIIIQSGSNDEIRNLVNYNDIHVCGKGVLH